MYLQASTSKERVDIYLQPASSGTSHANSNGPRTYSCDVSIFHLQLGERLKDGELLSMDLGHGHCPKWPIPIPDGSGKGLSERSRSFVFV